jgi:hypothetical protein
MFKSMTRKKSSGLVIDLEAIDEGFSELSDILRWKRDVILGAVKVLSVFRWIGLLELKQEWNQAREAAFMISRRYAGGKYSSN